MVIICNGDQCCIAMFSLVKWWSNVSVCNWKFIY